MGARPERTRRERADRRATLSSQRGGILLGQERPGRGRRAPCSAAPDDRAAPGPPAETATAMMKTILLPVDLSALGEEACRTGIDLGRRYGATLHFLYVLPDYGYPSVAAYFPEEAQRRAQDDAVRDLAQFVERLPLEGVASEQHVRMGTVYREILDCAEDLNAELIVIASRSPHGLERFLLGSNAEKVAHYAHCSVLLLRPPH